MAGTEGLRILLINQSYVPDKGASGQLLGDLFSSFQTKGASVTVICAPPTYTDEALDWRRFEQGPSIQIHRVGPGCFRGRKSMLNRVAGYLGFMWAAFRETRKLTRIEQFQVVATASNPPFVGLIGAWCHKRRRIPFVYMLHDLHPDILLKSGFHLPRAAARVWERTNRSIFEAASCIVVLGEGMKRHLEDAKGVPGRKIRVIHNWAHPEYGAPIARSAARKHFEIEEGALAVLHFGNMGESHNLGWLLEAAAQLQHRNIEFIFAGEGPQKPALIQQCRELGLESVRFIPYQSGEAFRNLVAASDICVVTLKNGLKGLAVPSKTYSILGGGRAALAIMEDDADVAELVIRHRCGWVASTPAEVLGVIEKALEDPGSAQLAGENAWNAYQCHFAFSRAIDDYWTVLSQHARIQGA